MQLQSSRSAGAASSPRRDSGPAATTRFTLRGPARRVAIGGTSILSLFGATVGIMLWRYGVAASQARVALAKETAVAISAGANDFLVERVSLIGPNRHLDPAQVSQLAVDKAELSAGDRRNSARAGRLRGG